MVLVGVKHLKKDEKDCVFIYGKHAGALGTTCSGIDANALEWDSNNTVYCPDLRSNSLLTSNLIVSDTLRVNKRVIYGGDMTVMGNILFTEHIEDVGREGLQRRIHSSSNQDDAWKVFSDDFNETWKSSGSYRSCYPSQYYGYHITQCHYNDDDGSVFFPGEWLEVDLGSHFILGDIKISVPHYDCIPVHLTVCGLCDESLWRVIHTYDKTSSFHDLSTNICFRADGTLSEYRFIRIIFSKLHNSQSAEVSSVTIYGMKSVSLNKYSHRLSLVENKTLFMETIKNETNIRSHLKVSNTMECPSISTNNINSHTSSTLSYDAVRHLFRGVVLSRHEYRPFAYHEFLMETDTVYTSVLCHVYPIPIILSDVANLEIVQSCQHDDIGTPSVWVIKSRSSSLRPPLIIRMLFANDDFVDSIKLDVDHDATHPPNEKNM